jgi:hypothetical protein
MKTKTCSACFISRRYWIRRRDEGLPAEVLKTNGSADPKEAKKARFRLDEYFDSLTSKNSRGCGVN